MINPKTEKAIKAVIEVLKAKHSVLMVDYVRLKSGDVGLSISAYADPSALKTAQLVTFKLSDIIKKRGAKRKKKGAK